MSDQYIEAIKSEVTAWPGANVSIERRRKHRAVKLSYGQRSRMVIIPTSGSDHRGPKNAVTRVRRELKEMGATKLGRAPVGKREKAEVETSAVARLGVNKTSVVFTVPKSSPLYGRFVEDGKSKHFWGFELRAVVDPKGTPHLAVVQREAPAEYRHPGVAKGCVNKQTDAFFIAIMRKQFKAMNRMGMFSSQPIDLYQEKETELLFKLPANRKPLIVRGAAKEAPTPKPAETPKPETPKAEPEVARAVIGRAERRADEHGDEEDKQPTPIILQAPRERISLERAINVVNAYKRKMEGDLRLAISEGGFLAANAKLGVRD